MNSDTADADIPGHVLDTTDVAATEPAVMPVAALTPSPRTLRRHKACGTIPDAFRKRGRDGRTYPATPRPPAPGRRDGPLVRDLRMALSAIRRTGKAPSFGRADLADLRAVVAEARLVLEEWEEDMATVLRARAEIAAQSNGRPL